MAKEKQTLAGSCERLKGVRAHLLAEIALAQRETTNTTAYLQTVLACIDAVAGIGLKSKGGHSKAARKVQRSIEFKKCKELTLRLHKLTNSACYEVQKRTALQKKKNNSKVVLFKTKMGAIRPFEDTREVGYIIAAFRAFQEKLENARISFYEDIASYSDSLPISRPEYQENLKAIKRNLGPAKGINSRSLIKRFPKLLNTVKLG
jgi:hypothetical protein